MSLEYCEECDKMIDLDTDAEHFEEHKDNKKGLSDDEVSSLLGGLL